MSVRLRGAPFRRSASPARRAASPARTAILAGGAVVTTGMTLVSLYGVLTRVVGPGAWGAVGIEALLAAAFIYHYATSR